MTAFRAWWYNMAFMHYELEPVDAVDRIKFESQIKGLKLFPGRNIKKSDLRRVDKKNETTVPNWFDDEFACSPVTKSMNSSNGVTEKITKVNDMISQTEKHAEDFKVNTTDKTHLIDGVPSKFVNSFGSYIGVKFFLDGVTNKKDVHTVLNKRISISDFNKIKNAFSSCRFIHKPNEIEYELYDKSLGYVVIIKRSLDYYEIECATGYDELYGIIESTGEDLPNTPTATWVTRIDQYGELDTKTFSINSIYDYVPEFYPFMNLSLKDFSKKYMESKSSILLLIGAPGTGKTQFIRQLLQESGQSVLLTYSDDLKSTDALFSYFYDSPEKFLIIEDADHFIGRREDGNSNMKQLLNITDGLTANPEKKVIFSTNLPNLNRVDQALLRPGRCFDKLQFNKFKADDIILACSKIGIDVPTQKSEYSLAELFAIKNGEDLSHYQELSHRFGF